MSRCPLRAAVTALCFTAVTALHADALSDKITSGKFDNLQNSVSVTPTQISPEQQQLQKLTDTPEKPLDGVKVKVLDLNISKNSSIKLEYAPELKQGGVIDNKEQTNIKYELKF